MFFMNLKKNPGRSEQKTSDLLNGATLLPRQIILMQ